MTVAELRAALESLPDDARVLIWDVDYGGSGAGFPVDVLVLAEVESVGGYRWHRPGSSKPECVTAKEDCLMLCGEGEWP